VLGGDFWASSRGKARPAPLANIPIERKLAHHQYLPANISQAQVELPLLIFKEAQPRDLARQGKRLGLAIVVGHTKQNQEAFAYGADNRTIDGNTGLLYTLYHCSHIRSSSI
jgi:hypothetical protein